MIYQLNQLQIKYKTFKEEEYFPYRHPRFATIAIHTAQGHQAMHGSINVPIHLSQRCVQQSSNTEGILNEQLRSTNPTKLALEQCLAALEYGSSCISFTSGSAATVSLIHTLKKGDHMLVCDDVYGGTQRYLRHFAAQHNGIQVQFVDMTDISKVCKTIKKTTKIVWIQSPTNPTMKIIDINEICKEIKSINGKIRVIVDNTFCSPYISSPLLLGADIVYHSLSKFIGGHADLIMGALVFKQKALKQEVIQASSIIGALPSPFDCYLALRGLKTLELRVIQSTRNAYHIAHYLKQHRLVLKVNYPGLKKNKYHETAKKQMRGYGSIISFKVKGGYFESSKFLRHCKVFTLAESLGGVESLAECPAFMTHSSIQPKVRAGLGITDNLIRLSIGVEELDDLMRDVEQALQASQRHDQ